MNTTGNTDTSRINTGDTNSSLPTIEISLRDGKGSSLNRRLRKEGLIPSIVYHKGEVSLNASVVYKDFYRIASQSTSSQVFLLKSNDQRFDGKTCLVKEIQKDFLKNKVLHVDFQTLKDDEQITVRVPIHVKGEATGVKNEGGILTVLMHDLGVTCLPRQIPKDLIINVAELKLGESIHASDIELPSGVSLDDDAHETIVSVVAVRVVEETPVADAAATPEAAAAPAAEAAGAADKKDKKK